MKTVEIPVTMKFQLPDGSTKEIPEGSLLEVDESSNFCIFAGYLPADPDEIEFGEEGSSAKLLNFRICNTRLHKNSTGGVKTYDSARFAKVRGQALSKAEGLRSGSRVVVSGFQATDRPYMKDGSGNVVLDERNQPKRKWLDYVYVRDLAVLSTPKGEKKAKSEEAPARKAKAEAPGRELKVPA